MTNYAVTETNGMSEGGFGPRVYLDTNVFIRAFEASPEEVHELLNAFAFMQHTFIQHMRKLAVTSELTLAELFAPKWTNDGTPVAASTVKRRFYLNLIVWSGFIDLRPVSRTILIETADLRMHARVKLPDAIHIVTAIEARCAYFMSGDRGTKHLPEQMKHLLPNSSVISALMDALRG
jgi:predicted nucleic acid-binding protein